MSNKVICSEEDLIAVANATRKKTGQTSTMSLKEMANEINSMSYEGGEYVEQDPTVPAWAKQPNKPNYTAEEVGARPANWMPTAEEIGVVVEESDPTVPAWAKETSKPTYTADEVGAAPAAHNQSASTITAGTFAETDIKAVNGTDYSTARVRNISAGTTDLTAGSSTLDNGSIYLVYE